MSYKELATMAQVDLVFHKLWQINRIEMAPETKHELKEALYKLTRGEASKVIGWLTSRMIQKEATTGRDVIEFVEQLKNR